MLPSGSVRPLPGGRWEETMRKAEPPEDPGSKLVSCRLSWPAGLLVAVYSGSVLLLNPGVEERTLTYHEVVFAQPAREMIATGNWLLPTFNGVPYTDKTPGPHWAIAIARSSWVRSGPPG